MSFVKSIIGANYRILRAPAGLLRDKVIKRLPDDSLIRLSADGTLGLLDAIVGRITDDDELRDRGGTMAKDVTSVLQNHIQKKPFNPHDAMTPPPGIELQHPPRSSQGIEVDGYMAP